jgi:hypothetical protein
MTKTYRFGIAQILAFALTPLYAADSTSSILDGTLDDLADLPGFKQPPTGAYAVSIVSIEEKKIGDHPAVEAKFKVKEVMEVTEKNVEDAEMMLVGDEFGIAFMLDNDTGVGFLKEFLKPLAESLNTQKNRETMAGAKGMDVVLVVKRTWNKEKEQHYCNLKKIEVL